LRNPRRPTRHELEQLAEVQHTSFGYPREEVNELVRGYSSVAVFDDYITTSPFYAGKLMLVVWAAFPSMYEAYIWDEHGRLRYVPHDLPREEHPPDERMQPDSVPATTI
jgi:hypothetical protein